MKKILNIKSWLLRKAPQFKMISDGKAYRIKDFVTFTNFDRYSNIYYNGRKGTILEFMADYVHVQIEARKSGFVEYPGMEFDPNNYEVIEVQINDVELRENSFRLEFTQ